MVVPFTHSISKENSIQPDVLLQMLQPELEAIVNNLIQAYLKLKANNYVFSGTGMWYDTYDPVEGCGTHFSLHGFIHNHYDVTGNPDDYVFTDTLYSKQGLTINTTVKILLLKNCLNCSRLLDVARKGVMSVIILKAALKA